MMHENLFPLREINDHLPRPISMRQAYRWVLKGCRGRKLETVRIGDTRYTSTEAIERFAEYSGDPPRAESRQRTREIEAAEKELSDV